MAKGKNLNPADALRKAQRKKELKKNKAERQKNRDFALVKKDTADLDDEIAELEGIAEPTNVQRARITELKAELAKIMKKKEEYVAEHPEQKHLVYRRRRDKDQDKDDDNDEERKQKEEQQAKAKRNLFNKHGLPRHPERSVYYDPVMNPFGMPPPGMPYVERALLPGEVDSGAEEGGSDGSDDDIMMPEGPPPGTSTGTSNGNEEDSDDDIPLPEGPPPGEEEDPPLPPGPPPLPSGPPPIMPPFAPNMPPQAHEMPFFPPPPPLSGAPIVSWTYPPQAFPPPPPLPPAGFAYPLPGAPPPPPPGFFPRRGQHKTPSASAMQDPLSHIPHQTYQAYQAARQAAPPLLTGSSSSSANVSSLPINPNLPPRPGGPPAPDRASSAAKADIEASATVSAAPQLRDLKKESTAFLPAALKRKKVQSGNGGGGGRVNAAPSVSSNVIGGPGDADGEDGIRNGDGESGTLGPKPDLLGSLRERFGPMGGAVPEDVNGTNGDARKKRKVEKGKDDYDKFLEEMGDMLGAQ